ncbi:MAG: YbhB/YbcL family Raf kinase inhibitor-like protein [Candidatus Omnitrophica bacterium]|nr:YbhB/YbcL family Raf kinase inhibitor-like protein [Candidatus Omnitrophota bacterium]MCM8793440.1 YbhB/YbcL family Raf kinase inhibitor-like protein [Candidatus Omnitrophota bacterium]
MKLNNFLFFFFLLSRLVFALEIESNSFRHNEFIPQRFTCEGENVSPHLSWRDIPEGTESFAIICDDPDAPMGTWVHWVIYDIPKEVKEFKEGTPPQGELPLGAKQGVNDFGKLGYGGPCPPPGKPHHYFFKIFALKRKLNLPPGLTKQKLLEAMEGYIIEKTELVGRYKR